jgi:hypothetical protein
VPRTVWIVSSGRTGTQFLAHYFDGNFDEVTALHEPPPRIRTRLVANAFAEAACSRARVVSLLQDKKRRIDDIGSALYVESNPFLWGAIGCLDEVFEDPMIVHVVRDPRAQVRSSLNHGTSTGLKALANRFVPYWYPSTPEDGGDWIARATGVWAFANRFLRDTGATCRDYRVLRYEDLFDETHSGLHALCDAFGVAFAGAGANVDPSRKLNRGAGQVLDDWRVWTDEQCALVHRIAMPLMADYGYGSEPDWQARIS